MAPGLSSSSSNLIINNITKNDVEKKIRIRFVTQGCDLKQQYKIRVLYWTYTVGINKAVAEALPACVVNHFLLLKLCLKIKQVMQLLSSILPFIQPSCLHQLYKRNVNYHKITRPYNQPNRNIYSSNEI